MEKEKEKYASMEENTEVFCSVGRKLCELVEQNKRSIKYYEGEIDKAREAGKEDNSFYISMIKKLKKENELLSEIENRFWSVHVMWGDVDGTV